MHIGDWLITLDGETKTFLSPWMSKQADSARFTYETIVTVGTTTFTVDILHKKSEDPGPGASASASFSTVTGNFKAATLTNLLEMFRYKYTLLGGGGDGNPAAVLYRMLEPTWFNQAEGTAP